MIERNICILSKFVFLLYRYAQKFRVNDTEYRNLYKVYGLRFVISITGKGGQFNIVNLFVAIGKNDSYNVLLSKSL